MSGDLTATSRFLSYVLRHRPDAIGIDLADGGWVPVDVLLAALAEHGRVVDRPTLDRLVAGDGTDKRRFELSGDRIRAAQGHSVPVDLRIEPVAPPPRLYHGTVERFVDRILAEGLQRGRRTHVHLSTDRDTATTVGARRGAPVILTVDAGGMHRDGHLFYRAANGVWLAHHVPPQWISGPG